MSDQVYAGPTVEEASRIRLAQINREIAELNDEKYAVKNRMEEYKGSHMLEAERIAARAELFLPSFKSNP